MFFCANLAWSCFRFSACRRCSWHFWYNDCCVHMVRALLQCFKDYLNYAKVRKFVLLDYFVHFVHFVLTWQHMCWGFEDGGMEMTRSAVLRSLSSQPSLLFSAPAVYHQNRQCRKDSKDIEACQRSGALKRFKSRLRTWKTLKNYVVAQTACAQMHHVQITRKLSH